MIKQNLLKLIDSLEGIKTLVGSDSESMRELRVHIEQDIRQYKARVKEFEAKFSTNTDELEVQIKLLSEELKQKYDEVIDEGLINSISKLDTKEAVEASKKVLEEHSHKVLSVLGDKLEKLKNKL